MSKLLIFDFKCTECSEVFEDLQQLGEVAAINCPTCQGASVRTISGTRLDPNMGLSNDFPSMAAKWEKRTRARARNDKLTDNPNLWMY